MKLVSIPSEGNIIPLLIYSILVDWKLDLKVWLCWVGLGVMAHKPLQVIKYHIHLIHK